MIRPVFAAILLLSVLNTPAFAADKKARSSPQQTPPPAKIWTKEPDAFLGIPMFASFLDSTPECPRNKYGVDFTRARQDQKVCINTAYSKETVDVWGTPDLGFDYRVTANAWSEGVGYFYLDTAPIHFNSLVNVFISRYGEPTRTEKSLVKTKAGAEFQNESATWEGKAVTIRLQKYSGDINTSTAIISSNAYDRSQAEKRNEKAATGASKL